MYKSVILNKLVDYLKLKNVKLYKTGKMYRFDCPICNNKESAQTIPGTYKFNCFSCRPKENEGDYFNLIDVVRTLEKDKESTKEEEILHYLKELLDVKVTTQVDQENYDEILSFYDQNKFALIALVKNSKIPIQEMKGWSSTEYRNIEEWKNWLKNGCNLAIRAGKVSGITVLDIDAISKAEAQELYAKKSEEEVRKIIDQNIPENIKKYLFTTLTQKCRRGYHLIYKYDKDLPKTGIKFERINVDIETDGGYIVCAPSIEGGVKREFKFAPIEVMPKELKDLLLPKVVISKQTYSEKIKDNIQNENFKINPEDFKLKNNNLEGCCNSSFVQLGGVLRKELNSPQTEFVLQTLNKCLLEKPMEQKTVSAMAKELEKYIIFDEDELTNNILKTIREVESISKSDLELSVVGSWTKGEAKKRFNKALLYLMKENKILRKGKYYKIIQKAEWKTELINITQPLNFKIPYFDNVAHFHWAEKIIIGGETGTGKTHLVMNLVRRLVDQGVHPYLIELEPNKRFLKIALSLGLKEHDFYYDYCDPLEIQLEPNAVTIIDWILPKNYAEVDKLFYNYNQQLLKTNGFLIIFMQLKEGGEWFSKNLTHFFSSLSAKYLLEDKKNNRTYSKFVIDKINDPKYPRIYEMPCQYIPETNEVKTIEEIERSKK